MNKFKKALLAVAVSASAVGSVSVSAEQIVLGGSLGSFSYDNSDLAPDTEVSYGGYGVYYFNDLSTMSGPIEQKGFNNRVDSLSVNINGNYLNSDLGAGGESTQNFITSNYDYTKFHGDAYFKAGYEHWQLDSEFDVNDYSDSSTFTSDIINLDAGYFVGESTLLSAGIKMNMGEFEDGEPVENGLYNVALRTYQDLGANGFALELKAEFDKDVSYKVYSGAADYYFTNKTSLGLLSSTVMDDRGQINEVGVRASHFLNNQFKLGAVLSHVPQAKSDGYTIAAETTNYSAYAEYRF